MNTVSRHAALGHLPLISCCQATAEKELHEGLDQGPFGRAVREHRLGSLGTGGEKGTK